MRDEQLRPSSGIAGPDRKARALCFFIQRVGLGEIVNFRFLHLSVFILLQLYKGRTFWINILDAIYQSLVIFFFMYWVRLRCDVVRLTLLVFCFFNLIHVAIDYTSIAFSRRLVALSWLRYIHSSAPT